MRHIHRNRQAGFALVSGIFILVILAALGAFMVTISGLQHTSSALDVLGARAYHAARSGIDWGAYQITSGTNGTAYAQSCVTAPVTQTIVMTDTLAEFTVNVDCTAFSALEAGETVQLYQITSTATRGVVNSSTYVERQLLATIERNE